VRKQSFRGGAQRRDIGSPRLQANGLDLAEEKLKLEVRTLN
jgi:hypothetical protein